MATRIQVGVQRASKGLMLLMGLLLLCSCDPKRVFDEYHDIDGGWHKDSIVQFELPVLSAKKRYDLYLNIRDNSDYPFQNLFLIVKLKQPGKWVQTDTLEYAMAQPDGQLLGEGFTDTKDNKLFYKKGFRPRQTGTYAVSIQQAVRKNGDEAGLTRLPGIKAVGVRIEPAE